MGNNDFKEISEELVRNYIIEHLDKSDEPVEFTVFTVWSCKTLQNNKTLISSSLPDGMYYEVTFNGDESEIYFDAYKKFENKCLKLEDIEEVC